MGGFFGAVSHQDVTLDIFFGVDYHSHLGTRRGGMIIHDAKDGFQRQIHSIENTPFRTKFEKDLSDFHGCSGIGCISDTDPQPLLVRSHLGLYAITTVGHHQQRRGADPEVFFRPRPSVYGHELRKGQLHRAGRCPHQPEG